MDRIIPCPCTKDCPKRSVECRSSCTKYKIYNGLKAREYEKRQKERECAELEYGFAKSFSNRFRNRRA